MEIARIEKATVESLLSTIQSGIAFDIAKNHTGIVIWDNGKVETYGFKLCDYDKNDKFGHYRLRRDFKNKVKEIVNNRHFDYCIVEDIYLGENFETVRILAELNTVPDECLFDGVFTTKEFIRWKPSEWQSRLRVLYKQRGRYKSKIETQNVLEYLSYSFFLDNKDLKTVDKEKIFFEDICDATGMLLALVERINFEQNVVNKSAIPISKIKMVYLEDVIDSYDSRDKRVADDSYILVDLDYKNLEKSICNLCGMYPNELLCAYLPPNKLGNFGIRHNFKYFSSGEGYLFFYKR